MPYPFPIPSDRPRRKPRPLPLTIPSATIIRALDSMPFSSPIEARNRTICEILYSTGITSRELCALRLEHVHTINHLLHVARPNKASELIPIGNTALQALVLFSSIFRRFFSPHPIAKSPLFITAKGEPMTPALLNAIVRQTFNSAGALPRVTPRILRNSFAAHMLDGGANMRAVQEMLGLGRVEQVANYTRTATSYLRNQLATYHPAWQPTTHNR